MHKHATCMKSTRNKIWEGGIRYSNEFFILSELSNFFIMHFIVNCIYSNYYYYYFLYLFYWIAFFGYVFVNIHVYIFCFKFIGLYWWFKYIYIYILFDIHLFILIILIFNLQFSCCKDKCRNRHRRSQILGLAKSSLPHPRTCQEFGPQIQAAPKSSGLGCSEEYVF